MTNLLRILFAGMAMGLAFSATARTAASPESPDTLPIYRPLTLDDALTLMLTENSALKAAAHEAHAAAQQRRAAIGLRMPQIGVTGAYTYLAKEIGFDFNHLKIRSARSPENCFRWCPTVCVPRLPVMSSS